MIDQRRNAPRRYFVDAQGRRVLIGLSLQQTAEFEALDLSPNNTVQFASEILRERSSRRCGRSSLA